MKVIVFTKNWLGDLLFQFPAIQAIKTRWPDAEIICLTPERCRDIAAYHPAVSEVVVFDERAGEQLLLNKIKFVSKLRRQGPWDQAYLFHRSRTRAAMAVMLGARARIGYGSRRRWFLTTSVKEPAEPMHHVDYYLHLLDKAGVPASGERLYRFSPRSEDYGKANEILTHNRASASGYACFHLGANWEPKRWPVLRFAEAADLIHDKWNFPVFLTGSAQDSLLAEQVLTLVKKARVISLAGRTPFGELAALFQSSSFVISGDSGPMHIASAAGARVAALFGPTDPRLTGPRGPGESLVIQHIPEGYSVPWIGEVPGSGWLEHISAAQVVRAIEKRGWYTAGIPASEGKR